MAILERESVGEGPEERAGKAARDDGSSSLLQADPATDWGTEPAPGGLEELLQLWISARGLRKDQHVRSRSSHAASEATQPTALSTAGRSQPLQADPAFWAGTPVRWAPSTACEKPVLIRFQESRMPGDPLVRFDEGRVGTPQGVALSPTLPVSGARRSEAEPR